MQDQVGHDHPDQGLGRPEFHFIIRRDSTKDFDHTVFFNMDGSPRKRYLNLVNLPFVTPIRIHKPVLFSLVNQSDRVP
jgi:hypothetical protein